MVSDSLYLKQDAKRLFGDKLITNTKHRPIHSGTGGSERGGQAQQLLFSEQLTLSMCNYFIISHDSHVGRLAVWLSEFGGSRNASIIPRGKEKMTSDLVSHICPFREGLDDSYLADEGAGI